MDKIRKLNTIDDIKTYDDFVKFFNINLILNNNVINIVDDFELENGDLFYYYDNVNDVEITESEYEEFIDAGRSDDEFDECYNEIFQYYIVNGYDAETIGRFTDDPVFYSEELDMYLWGICHYGTGWDYVPIELTCGESVPF